MSMKKRITFIATLLILSCVAFAGNSAWAQTMNRDDVVLYNTADPIEAPYSRISRTADGNNRTVYYKGTGYTKVLNNTDIWVVTYSGDSAVKSFPINPTLGLNKCSRTSSGVLTGNFTINDSDLIDITQVEVSITGMSESSDGVIEPKTFDVDNNLPGLITTNPSFTPDSGSNIRNFFIASVAVDPNIIESGDDDNLIYAWLKTGTHNVHSGATNYGATAYGKGQSAEFANPASILIDASKFRDRNAYDKDDSTDPNTYDLGFVYSDQAKNGDEVGTSNNITFYRHLDPNTGRDAHTALSADGDYQVIIPRDPRTNHSIIFNSSIGSARVVVNVNGQKWNELNDVSVASLSGDPNWEVLTIDLDDADDLGIDSTSWTTDKLTIGVDKDGSSNCDIYFGVEDGVGPRLLVSQVVGDKTQLTFSEDLLSTGSVHLDVIQVKDVDGDDTDWHACKYSITFGPDPNMLTISKALVDGQEVKINAANNKTRKEIKDKSGNLAVMEDVVTTRTSRFVSKVEVIDVDPDLDPTDSAYGTTTFYVYFNGPLDVYNTALDESKSYRITMGSFASIPEEELPSNFKNTEDGVDYVDSSYVFPGGLDASGDYEGRRLTITVGAAIRDTAKDFPQVEVVGELKGDTYGDLLGNTTASTEDKVGPYIMSASYDRNPDKTQGHSDDVKDHVLTINFSEVIDFSALDDIHLGDSVEDAFDITGAGSFYRASYIGNKDATSLSIRMYKDVDPLLEGASGVYIRQAVTQIGNNTYRGQLVKDLRGNEACTSTSNEAVIVAHGTAPWVVSATTVDDENGIDGGDGHINALLLEFSDDITLKRLSNDPNIIGNNSEVAGYKIDRGVDNAGISYQDNNKVKIALISKTTSGDTGATPEVTLYLDSNNYYRSVDADVDDLSARADETINIPADMVEDGARPNAMKVQWQKTDTDRFTVRVVYSEAIDPNVWKERAPDDCEDPNAAYCDFGIYTNAACTNAASDVTIKTYAGNACAGNVLVFRVESNKTNLEDLFVAPIYTSEDRTTGVYDYSGLYAKNKAYFGSHSSEMSDLAAKEYKVTAPTDSVSTHAPAKSKDFMVLYGTVIGMDGETAVPGDSTDEFADLWKVYAYSLDNLFLFKHKQVRDKNGNTLATARTIVINKTSTPDLDDPNDQAIESILAPTDAQGGVCYGSGYVRDGQYAMYVYGEAYDTPGFLDGTAMSLVVESSTGDKYLVTNNCSSDKSADSSAVSFYREWVKDGIQMHNIDLSKYEEKKLEKGWNFISISALKRYVLHDPAVVTDNAGPGLQDASGHDLSQSVCPIVLMDDVDNVLTSLNKQWNRIFTYDCTKNTVSKAIRMQKPAVTSGNKIEFFSVGHGYWIYVPYVTNPKLVALGDIAIDDEAGYKLPLTYGNWSGYTLPNYVGYWGGAVYYEAMDENIKGRLSSAAAQANNYNLLGNIGNIFLASLPNSGVSTVTGCYTNEGARRWYKDSELDAWLGDLVYVAPGYGYSVDITSNCYLSWKQ